MYANKFRFVSLAMAAACEGGDEVKSQSTTEEFPCMLMQKEKKIKTDSCDTTGSKIRVGHDRSDN